MMRTLATVPAMVFFTTLLACGPSSPGGDDTIGLQAIEVKPANATVLYTGTAQPIDYTAIGHYADGHQAPLTAVAFSLDGDASQIGTLTQAKFAANGVAAGTGTVTAVAGSLSGATGVSVIMHTTHVDPMAPAGSESNFPDVVPTGAQAPTIAYPLDGAVMPISAAAPDVQWEGPAATGDLFRVRIVGGLATIDDIIAVTPGFKLDTLPLANDWQAIVRSAHGSPVSLNVDHWDAITGAQRAGTVTIKVVQAQVTGVIYYWDLSQGIIQRIDSAGRAAAIPNPPASPGDANNHCVACHVVSRDGRYLAGELWGGGDKGAVFDLSNPAVPTVTPVGGTSYTSLFSTFNADATRLMTNPGTALQLVDPQSGTSVATSGVALPTMAAHPSWSPDGTSIVFVNNISLGGAAAPWAVDYDRGDLQLISALGNDTFGAPVSLIDAATAGAAFAAPSWPTFTPDSKFIAYAAGVNSRGRNTNGTTEVMYPGSLFIIPTIGGPATKLDTACAGVADCYLPNFSPYDDGGYVWLVFYSLRDYGNTLAGTKGTQRRQMWVTAIDKSKLGTGIDPSSVPYWLPMQDSQTENMSSFWALPPPPQ